MNPIDFTALPLRDIHLPAAVGWWPLAPGWWILIGVIVAVAIGFWLRYRQTYRERAALKALKRNLRALEAGESPLDCAQKISLIVRRFAMSVAGAAPVAGLTGESWLGFLDGRWQRADFSDGAGRILIYGPYAPKGRVGADDVSALNSLCIDWVRAQRVEK